jgi:1-acylglycerone phosphate reductase
MLMPQQSISDVLVNNAGLNGASGITAEISIDQVKATFETNVSILVAGSWSHDLLILRHSQYFGLLRVTQAVSAHMIPRRSGTIINIGSISAYINLPFTAAYTNSKAAVHSLSDVLRSELSPFNIRVLLVAPGGIKSSFGDNAVKGLQLPSDSSPFVGARQAIKDRVVMSQQSGSTPADVFAKWVRKEAERGTLRQRHYLTAGSKSLLAWIISYLPPFIRDFIIWRLCNLGSIRRRA